MAESSAQERFCANVTMVAIQIAEIVQIRAIRGWLYDRPQQIECVKWDDVEGR